MRKDAVAPLFEGCNDGHTRLKVTLRALEIKAKHKMTDECFDENIEFVHDLLPKKGNTCPTSIAEAKKIACPLNLPVVKYHVCINDCIIYRGEDAEKTTCPVCKTSRYKRGTKKAPRKVVWYFPLTSRLQRYFADPKEARLMRWHAERKRPEDDDPDKEEMLRHPSDACQWKALDLQYHKHFGKESRNLRLGVSTDGLNPFGSQSSTHSTWPVFVWIYNLPPWLCMKKKYVTMSMLIQGPKQPGTDINLYLTLLKEELATLWEEGARTWDASRQDYFNMKAAVITTVQDYPGYGYFSGQVVQGFYGCVRCKDNTSYTQLQKDLGSGKTVHLSARRWLPMDHPWRKLSHLFDGKVELRGKPDQKSGAVIAELLNNWKECPAPGKTQKKPEPLLKVWKARSVFWDLPYWKILRVPHSLDLMHITKNVGESLLATILNTDKTKDGPKARNDLKHMGIRVELQPPPSDDEEEEETETQNSRRRRKGKKGEVKLKAACFTLSKKEAIQFMKCLLGVKFPNGFAGKISRWLDEAKQRFSGMKSHDVAVLMTQVLPVAIRGIMDKHVRETLFGLCNFFDVISRKSIGIRQLTRLQEEIVVIVCELEMYFPPAFFDVMVHLLLHVVEDIVQLGPPFLRSMMPFERLNGHIKGYVKNRSRPDGSIANGFLAEECISFCSNFLQSETPVGLPTNKHFGRLAGLGHHEGRHPMHVDFEGRTKDFERANLVALQHLEVVDPYINEHKEFIKKIYADRGRQVPTEAVVMKEHNSGFTRWFRNRVFANPPHGEYSEEDKLIFALAQGAAHNLMTYQAYDINGYTFYTEDKDNNCDYQNSGVTGIFYTGDVPERYYGRIEEIWELDYVTEKVPMFRVRWAKSVEKEGRYFTTMVIPPKSKTTGANAPARNEPWVMASQVDQCWFITDPSKPSRVVVRRGKRNIIGMDGVANEQDFDQNGDPKMEDGYGNQTPYTTTAPKKGVLPYKRSSEDVPDLTYATATKRGKKKMAVKKR